MEKSKDKLTMKPNKTLCGLLLFGLLKTGACMPVSATAQGIDKFKDYRTQSKNTITILTEWAGITWHNTMYDLNGDGKYDVSELRRIMGDGPEGSKLVVSEALVYGYDINQNDTYEPNETYIDVNEDGWDGDEQRLDTLEGTLEYKNNSI